MEPRFDFEEIEHTADWALRVRGRDLGELMVNAARGMGHLLVDTPDDVPTEIEQQFDLEGYDPESLLVTWLSELAYWAEMEGIVFKEFELKLIGPTHLQAVGRGGQAPDLKKHIKAVTFHDLEIIQTDDRVETTIVFDV